MRLGRTFRVSVASWSCGSPISTFWQAPNISRLGFMALKHLRVASTTAAFRPTFGVLQQHDPLRILFCGSDTFSVASLEALNRIHQERPEVIESVDVLCKEDQRTGRGLKNINEVPIKKAAAELSLPYHQIRSFKDLSISGLRHVNLLVAVSFGLFIPASLIEACKYGGLNVHPSALPDLPGAAPLENALLQGRKEIGITLQTLDTKRFDHGAILRQIRNVTIPSSESIKVSELKDFAADLGASILRTGILNADFIPEINHAIPKPFGDLSKEKVEIIKAPKITPETRHIDWSTWPADKILRYNRIVGPLWCRGISFRGKKSSKKAESPEPLEIRMQLFGINQSNRADLLPSDAGHPFILQSEDLGHVFIRTCDDRLLEVSELRIEGDITRPAATAAKKAKLVQHHSEEKQAQDLMIFFHEKLM